MEYIKIPIDSWTDSQIVSIKNKCNANYGANFTDADVVNVAIDLLSHIIMINNGEFAEHRTERHINRILEITTDKTAFAKYVVDAPKNQELMEKVFPVFNDLSKGEL